MTRPERQLTHLDQKLAEKAARRPEKRKPGAKERRWKKSAERYRAVVAGGGADTGAAQASEGT
jgi:hypothetical protein